MDVTLRPMRDEELDAWLPRVRADYVDDQVRYRGMDPDAARAKVDREAAVLFPGDRLSAGHAVYVVEADGERVGDLWLADQDDDLGRLLFVWNIWIDEGHRDRGVGRAAMRLVEAEARRRGLTRIGLGVMGANQRARHLYRSLGYVETVLSMERSVEVDAAPGR